MAELEAFRELQKLQRDLERGRVVNDLDRAVPGRLEYLEKQTSELTEFLRSAGWQI